MSRGSSQLDSDFIQDSSDADTSRESVRSSLILGSRNKGFLSDVLWAIVRTIMLNNQFISIDFTIPGVEEARKTEARRRRE